MSIDRSATLGSLGHHSPGLYVALFARICAEQRSGVLEVRSGSGFRRLYFVMGSPVWFESDRERDVLSGEERDDQEARLRIVKRGVGLPLQWARGGWTFERTQALPVEVLSRSVFLDCGPLATLWAGVRSAVRVDEVLAAVTESGAGNIQPLPGLELLLSTLEIEGPLAGLARLLDGPRPVDDLLRAYASEHEDLLKLLWTVEVMGFVQRSGDRHRALGFRVPEADPFGVQEGAAAPALEPEPDTAEVEFAPGPELSPGQVVDAIRRGDPSRQARLAARPPEDSGELESLVIEDDDAEGGSQPVFPGYRPSAASAPRAGRYVHQAAVASTNGDLRVPDALLRPDSGLRPRTDSGLRPRTDSGLRPRTDSGLRPRTDSGLRPPPDSGQRSATDSGALPSGADPRRAPMGDAPALSTSGSIPESPSAEAVRREYDARMGTDYYTFLGVPAGSALPTIERAWTRLLGRFTAASKSGALPPDVRQLARELAQVAHLAGRTFSDPARRQEYDRRLARGQAPLTGRIQAPREVQTGRTNPGVAAVAEPTTDPLARARLLFEKGDWARGLSDLRRLRVERPSDPDVLAELGFAVWKASAETERGEAEEFLSLALAFDSRHLRARELLARLALDAGDVDAARDRLTGLLRLAPELPWARSELQALPPADEPRPSGSKRLAFWKK